MVKLAVFAVTVCPSYNYKVASCNHRKTLTLSLDFLSYSTASDCVIHRPLVCIDVLHGFCCIAYNAKYSLTGFHLLRILLHSDISYNSNLLKMTSADGNAMVMLKLLLQLKLYLSYSFLFLYIQIIVYPVDFIQSANIIIDIHCNRWHFGECPKVTYVFARKSDYKLQCPLNFVE